MVLAERSKIVPLPSDEVPIWVQSTRTAVYLNVVLATLVIYDTGESVIDGMFDVDYDKASDSMYI